MPRRKRQRGLRGAGTIEQMASGRWRLKVPYGGKRVTYGIFPTEPEAQRAQADWRMSGVLPSRNLNLHSDSEDAEIVKLDTWFGRWQEAKAQRAGRVRVDKKRGGALTTADKDRNVWYPWWSPTLGAMEAQDVSESDILKIIRKIESTRAPNTLDTHYRVIRAFFNWLVQQNAIEDSPLVNITIDVDPVADRVREIVVPDFRFIDMLSERFGEGQERLVFELLLATGGRRSEVAGMTVGDMDFPRHRIWIRRPIVDVGGTLHRKAEPKGGHQRSVAFGPELGKMLRAHLLKRGMPEATAPLFTMDKGGPLRWNHYLPRTLRPVIVSTAVRWAVGERKRLLEEGVPKSQATAQAVEECQRLKGLEPHHLRHTAAALMWAAGASDIEVQLTLGHAQLETSRRLYAHTLKGAAHQAAVRVERMRQASW